MKHKKVEIHRLDQSITRTLKPTARSYRINPSIASSRRLPSVTERRIFNNCFHESSTAKSWRRQIRGGLFYRGHPAGTECGGFIKTYFVTTHGQQTYRADTMTQRFQNNGHQERNAAASKFISLKPQHQCCDADNTEVVSLTEIGQPKNDVTGSSKYSPTRHSQETNIEGAQAQRVQDSGDLKHNSAASTPMSLNGQEQSCDSGNTNLVSLMDIGQQENVVMVLSNIPRIVTCIKLA